MPKRKATPATAEKSQRRTRQSSAAAAAAAAPAAAAALPEAKSPSDEYFDRLTAVSRATPGSLGTMLVIGVPRTYDEETGEPIRPDVATLSAEQCSHLRHIVMTKDRNVQFGRMHDAVLGDQAQDTVLFFTGDFSRQVFAVFDDVLSRKTKDHKERFDTLLAFTYHIHRHNYWAATGHPDLLQRMIKLGRQWTALLKKSNKGLGIDAEFTRPAVLGLCRALYKLVFSGGGKAELIEPQAWAFCMYEGGRADPALESMQEAYVAATEALVASVCAQTLAKRSPSRPRRGPFLISDGVSLSWCCKARAGSCRCTNVARGYVNGVSIN